MQRRAKGTGEVKNIEFNFLRPGFPRHFYKPQPLRTLDEISANILALEKESEGLLADIIGGTA